MLYRVSVPGFSRFNRALSQELPATRVSGAWFLSRGISRLHLREEEPKLLLLQELPGKGSSQDKHKHYLKNPFIFHVLPHLHLFLLSSGQRNLYFKSISSEPQKNRNAGKETDNNYQ
jgi:hypothetical protein